MDNRLTKEIFYRGFPLLFVTMKNKINRNDRLVLINSIWIISNSNRILIVLKEKEKIDFEKGTSLTINLPDKQILKSEKHCLKKMVNSTSSFFSKNPEYIYDKNDNIIDEFTVIPGKTVETVRIKECPIQIETVVSSVLKKEMISIIECDIKGILINESILYNEKSIDIKKWKPLIY